MANSEPQPSENRTNTEDDGICSDEETSQNVPSDRVQPRREDWIHETEIKNRNNVNTMSCRTMTVGQARDEKGNTNSTEERRDDQPQALFDANDQQDHSSPKKGERREKTNQEVENNKKNKPQGKRITTSRPQAPNPETRSEALVSVIHCVVNNSVIHCSLLKEMKTVLKNYWSICAHTTF